MSLSVLDIITAIAPECASHTSIDTFITMATARTNACFFKANLNEAIAYRAAHMCTMSTRNGAGGTITLMKESELTKGFSQVNLRLNDNDLSQTGYGRMLIELRKSSGASLGVTGGLDDGCNASWPMDLL